MGQAREAEPSLVRADGWSYWIEAGASKLLEYSDTAQQRRGATRFCDYQVVRLYEDIIELAPHVLEPISPDLVPHINDEGRKRTMAKMSEWSDANPERDDDQYWATVGDASMWIGNRRLDTAYLSPSADIVMWSDEAMVHIEWDNREKLIDGSDAWSAMLGNYSLTRSDFIAECQSFHARLMSAMSERVSRVVAGALSPDVHVHVEGLVREHETRQRLLESNFGPLPSPTDWMTVRAALKVIGA